MEVNSESRWNLALTTKDAPILTPDKSTWNDRVSRSLARDRTEVEVRYSIRIGQTEIYCARCGKLCVPGHHTCAGGKSLASDRLPKQDVMREWKWCPSKEQRTCEEVCLNNLHTGKCLKTKKGCRVKPKPMTEEVKARLQAVAYNRSPKSRPAKRKPTIKIDENLLLKIRALGASRIASLLYAEKRHEDGTIEVIRDIPQRTVRAWILRGKIPVKYQDAVRAL